MQSAGPWDLTTVRADLLRSRERLRDALVKTTAGMPPSEARSFLLDLALLSLDAAVEAIDEVIDEVMDDSSRGGAADRDAPASPGCDPRVVQGVDP